MPKIAHIPIQNSDGFKRIVKDDAKKKCHKAANAYKMAQPLSRAACI